MREWVRRLNDASSSNPESTNEVQGLRLLQFFENMIEDEEASKLFETTKTEQISKALGDCGPFCEEWVDGNLKIWRELGFLA